LRSPAATRRRCRQGLKGYSDWRALVEDSDVQAIAIVTLPSVQVPVAQAALALGKPVFVEKPMANDLSAARTMLRLATERGLPTVIDFNFHQIMSWQRAKAMLDTGGYRHSAPCHRALARR
jgi:predicted dehydrogenase